MELVLNTQYKFWVALAQFVRIVIPHIPFFFQVSSFVFYSESAKKCYNDLVFYVDSCIFAVVLI